MSILRLPGALVAGAFFLTACSSDRALAPRGTVLTDGRVTADVSVSSGDAIAWDVERLEGIFSASGANAPSELKTVQPWNDPRCEYSAIGGRWNCVASPDATLITTRSYIYLDKTGKAMRVFDDANTESVRSESRSDGTMVRDSTYTAFVHRTRTIIVTGLFGQEKSRKWTSIGVSADTIAHSDNGSIRRYAGTMTDSLRSAVIPYPHRSDSWPLSGSSVRTSNFQVSVAGKATETRSVIRRVLVTYNGTPNVPIQNGSTTCTLHLDTHKVDGCSG